MASFNKGFVFFVFRWTITDNRFKCGASETIEHRACILVFGGGIFSSLSFGRGIMVVIGADGVIEQRVCIFDLRLHPRQDGQNGRVPQLNKRFVFFVFGFLLLNAALFLCSVLKGLSAGGLLHLSLGRQNVHVKLWDRICLEGGDGQENMLYASSVWPIIN